MRNVNVCILGGTGSIGRELTTQLLMNNHSGKIVIYSRDEAKQAAMAEEFHEGGASGVRYIVGDICDYDRLLYAMKGCDIAIHAAAMKRIDTCEYNPMESLKINVTGSQNVARACIECGVDSALFLSTDKACNPVSAYGAQKAAVERFWIGMNNMSHHTAFNVVRYGNVYGSRGSVIHKWREAKENGETLKVTSEKMTRFFWNIDKAARFIIERLQGVGKHADRGLIFIPKMQSFKMVDIARTVSNDIEIIGLRCPEKLNEDLISEFEGYNTYVQEGHFIIYPNQHNWAASIEPRGTLAPHRFNYSSELKSGS